MKCKAVVDKFGTVFWVKPDADTEFGVKEVPEEGFYPIYISDWTEEDLQNFGSVRSDMAGMCFKVSGFSTNVYDIAAPPTFTTIIYIRVDKAPPYVDECPARSTLEEL